LWPTSNRYSEQVHIDWSNLLFTFPFVACVFVCHFDTRWALGSNGVWLVV
jgi:hypothetical protein